ncbi:hypothetical protein F5Y16DRAFT_364929 [Xylariaceae sp. FL0255]|nr:hypothetical protein F5Y16DRAFT_364929 [Xylariaceae sp. FL0255]
MPLSVNSDISIRDQWARQQAILGVQSVWNDVVRRQAPERQDGLSLHGDTLPKAPSPTDNPFDEFEDLSIDNRVPQPKIINIGIIGAGAAGLFAAMVFDYLNVRLFTPTMNTEGPAEGPWPIKKLPRPIIFKYDIHEANSQDRLGGRLFTYNFGGAENRHDYYDVGAMRFPDNPVMRRAFDLFAKLGMERTDLKTNPKAKPGSLIPYYMKNGDTESGSIEPWRYNDITLWGGSFDQVRVQSSDDDPFKMANSENIPRDIRQHSPDDVMKAAIQPFRDALKRDVLTKPPGREGWDLLMRYDTLSTRQFLGMDPPEPLAGGSIPPPPYNYDTIQWMETFNGGTDWYDQAHSETVLESLDFEFDDETKWYCIFGGAQQLAVKMYDRILTKPTYNSQVMAIRALGPMQVELDATNKSKTKWSRRRYHGVFNTTTLSCLSRMDISQAGLNYSTKHACRSLGYGAAAKVAIKFKRAWWIHDLGKYSVKKGGLGHSDLAIRICVYPSYNIYDDESGTAVLLVSYTWQQDSQRLASLISTCKDHEKKVQEEAELKELLFRELARLHENQDMTAAEVYKLIEDNYIDHHAFDWYKDPTTAGSFAFFRPQQFSRMWNKMIQPSGDVVIVGEAASPHHAWVVGALESVVHGIHAWLGLNSGLVPEFKQAMRILEKAEDGNPFTGLPPYMDANLSQWQSILGMINRDEHLSNIDGLKPSTSTAGFLSQLYLNRG